jgi:3-oxoacyl-[acyl-carrier protein] reductase
MTWPVGHRPIVPGEEQKMSLTGKVAIVTGGGSGFGEGIARLFAEKGAKVVVADINDAGGERVTAEIKATGAEAVYVHADVATDAGTAGMIKAATDAFGRLDVLVNNAGYTHNRGPMTDVDEATFDKVFDVNVKSLFWAAKHAVPVFRAQKGGVMINIASTAAVRPRPGLVWYNGSKGAAVVITKTMAVELAPDNIRVCAVNPVMGPTGLTSAFLGQPDTPEARAKIIETIPLGRLSSARDVAEATAFLASDAASFLTGVCMEVDGGRCI